MPQTIQRVKKGYEEGLCPKRLVQQKLFDTFKLFESRSVFKVIVSCIVWVFAPSYLVFSISLQTWLLSQN